MREWLSLLSGGDQKLYHEDGARAKKPEAHKISNFIRHRNQSTCLAQQIENSNATHSKVHVGGYMHSKHEKLLFFSSLIDAVFLEFFSYFFHFYQRYYFSLISWHVRRRESLVTNYCPWCIFITTVYVFVWRSLYTFNRWGNTTNERMSKIKMRWKKKRNSQCAISMWKCNIYTLTYSRG